MESLMLTKPAEKVVAEPSCMTGFVALTDVVHIFFGDGVTD